jgi:hypothetical protein
VENEVIGSLRTMTAAAPEVIGSGETAAIVKGREVGAIPTEIALTDMNSPVAVNDQNGLIVLIKWIESNALSDRTVPAVGAINQSEALPSHLMRIRVYPTKARYRFRSSR